MAPIPKFLWDVEYLQALESELQEAGLRILCLSPVSFRLAADMSEMLLWPSRFGLNRYEDVPELADIAYQEVNNPMSCTDLLEAIASIQPSVTVENDISCGGCGGGGVYCVDENGDVIITPQIPIDEIAPPPGYDSWPIDPVIDDPPADFETWSEFDENACLAANYIHYHVIGMTAVLESVIDVAATIAALIVLVLPLLPAGFLAAIGGITLLEVLQALVEIVVSEQASDILLDFIDWLEDEKESIVCKIYKYRHDIPVMKNELAADFMAHLALTIVTTDEEWAQRETLSRSLLAGK